MIQRRSEKAIPTGNGYKITFRRTIPRQFELEEVRDSPCSKLAPANIAEELVEKNAVKQSVSRIEELVQIFIHATRVSGFNLVDLPTPTDST